MSKPLLLETEIEFDIIAIIHKDVIKLYLRSSVDTNASGVNSVYKSEPTELIDFISAKNPFVSLMNMKFSTCFIWSLMIPKIEIWPQSKHNVFTKLFLKKNHKIKASSNSNKDKKPGKTNGNGHIRWCKSIKRQKWHITVKKKTAQSVPDSRLLWLWLNHTIFCAYKDKEWLIAQLTRGKVVTDGN